MTSAPPTFPRASGVLLHPTALPGSHGIGNLGQQATRFIDFLNSAGQSVWQLLPLGPTGYGDSPYNALSAFAGNPLLIDLDALVEVGDLDQEAEQNSPQSGQAVDYPEVTAFKTGRLRQAADRFRSALHQSPRHLAFAAFCREQSAWLDDYALFMAIRDQLEHQPWWDWPSDLRRRDTATLARWRQQQAERIQGHQYQQFVFFAQWHRLRRYARQKGIQLFGDIPIFVSRDSADVWARQDLFQLDAAGQPTAVAGVPPDYFSTSGQLWGNPLYRWQQHAAGDYAWWLMRFRHKLAMFDLVRIDHFRGFHACWSIPAGASTAEEGHWEEVPGQDLFSRLRAQIPELPIIAEDLGVITAEVETLRDEFGFPGMKILQFAFDSDPGNPYLPHNYRRHTLVYTGTHDNDTTVGWWQGLRPDTRDRVAGYLGNSHVDIPWDLIRLAMSSVAFLCIIPCQDLLGLGSQARFNRPGQASGNWTWRLPEEALEPQLAQRLRALTTLYNRLPPSD